MPGCTSLFFIVAFGSRRSPWLQRYWTDAERQQVLEILFEYLNDPSSIVKTFSMQALADLARQSPALRPNVLDHLEKLTAIGTPAMKARGRKLLAALGVMNRGPAKPARKRHAR